MENKEKDYSFDWYYIRSMRLCGWLMYTKGMILRGMAPDRNNLRFNVFRFANSESLRLAISEYKNIPK